MILQSVSQVTDWVGSFVGDLTFGFRVLRKNPGFAALAIVTLALGIGAATAVFSVVNAVLLRALPYSHPEQLVCLFERVPDVADVPLEAWAPVNADFYEWRKQSRSFSHMALFTTDRLNVSVGDAGFRVMGSRVTGDFFRVLGISPVLGRGIDNADDQPGNGDVAVISHELWQSRFSADQGVIGRRLLVNAEPYRIIGVMPAGFGFPRGSESLETNGKKTDVWMPWAMTLQTKASRDQNEGNAIARLRAGVTLQQAQAEIGTITSRFAPPYTQQVRRPEGVVRSLDEHVVGNSKHSLLILLAAVFLVLMIACTNAAGLTLERGYGRTREIGMRVALGASRWRLVRQLLAESICIAGAGCLLGTLMAFALVRLLIRFYPTNIPRMEETSIDGRVLLFSVLISAAATILAGMVPAWFTSRCNVNEALKRSAGRSVKGDTDKFHRALIAGEIALTVVLLVGSGLLIRSFLKLQLVDKGFGSLTTVGMNIQLDARYGQTELQNAFFSSLLERVNSVTGVEAAAAVNHVPLGGGQSIWLLEVEGNPFDAKVSFEERSVTSRYFAAMGIPLLEGRVFAEAERAGGPLVAIVSQSFARRYFPGRSAIGRTMRAGGSRTIVGVVADVRQAKLDSLPPMQIYLPLWQSGSQSADLVVRTTVPPERIASTLRALVRDADPALALADARTIGDLVFEATAERRFQTMVLTMFGAIALFLSLVGLYVLMAWAVQQRTAEIGIRMALGAQRGGILWMVLRQGAGLWLAGLAAGFAAALGLTRWLSSLLFEVQPTDPATYVGVGILFCAVAIAACCVPARRATQVDPMVALRCE